MNWEIFIALLAVTSSLAQKLPAKFKGIQPLAPKEIEEFSKFLEKTSVIGNAQKDVTVPADNDAWVNSGKFEGDIILNDMQRKKIIAIVGKTGRAATTDLARLWPTTSIPYMIKTRDFHASQLAAITEILDFISNKTCLNFTDVSGTKTSDSIVIEGQRRGCFSSIGRQGGKQTLNLDQRHAVGSGCFRKGSIAHEMYHSLGFFHTHARMDRDRYVKIYNENIKEGKEHNFLKYVDRPTLGEGKDLLYYNYNSMLHYSRKAFSKNGSDTIVPILETITPIGQREYINIWDIRKLNALYCNYTMTPRPESSRKRPRPTKKQ